jgi:myo-inositol 2-dehydrogenase/D-chiro-inositol 1-dehydrogenase
MLRFGLLGAGRIGQIHGRNIAAAPGASLVAIADLDGEAAAALAERTGASVRDAIAIIAAGDIDAVLIGTPTDTHADLIEQAVKAGKAVLCEKPVDLDAKRIEACLKVVNASGKPLMIGFNRRFDPNFAALKNLPATVAANDSASAPRPLAAAVPRTAQKPSAPLGRPAARSH